MKNNNLVTIGKVIVALTEVTKDNRVSVRTAKEILVEIKRVFPNSETSLKSIYSTVHHAGIRMPGSAQSVIDVKAYEELLARLYPAKVAEVKTGTDKK